MASEFSSVKNAYTLPVGTMLTLRGWVRSRRDSKGVTLIELNDGSRFKSMQLVVESVAVTDDVLNQTSAGSATAASGSLVESPTKGQSVEIKVSEIRIYGTADPASYP